MPSRTRQGFSALDDLSSRFESQFFLRRAPAAPELPERAPADDPTEERPEPDERGAARGGLEPDDREPTPEREEEGRRPARFEGALVEGGRAELDPERAPVDDRTEERPEPEERGVTRGGREPDDREPTPEREVEGRRPTRFEGALVMGGRADLERGPVVDRVAGERVRAPRDSMDRERCPVPVRALSTAPVGTRSRGAGRAVEAPDSERERGRRIPEVSDGLVVARPVPNAPRVGVVSRVRARSAPPSRPRSEGVRREASPPPRVSKARPLAEPDVAPFVLSCDLNGL